MKTWDCYALVSGSKFLGTVEAETEDEAIDLAGRLDSAWVSLCHQCSGEIDDPQITDIEVEEAV